MIGVSEEEAEERLNAAFPKRRSAIGDRLDGHCRRG